MITGTSSPTPAGPTRRRLTANFHFIKSCNFRCDYCYATFADYAGRPFLPDEQLVALTRLLARRFTKVTFVGGEPTLYRRLPELLAVAKAEGALANVVTNGSRIDAAWIEAHRDKLDFLTLSIDSASADTHRALGRATKNGKVMQAAHHLELARAARALDVGVKINSVVTTLNSGEDMAALIRDIAPKRWKIMQATPVAGQNDRYIASLTPGRAEFDEYVARHNRALAGCGIRIVPEPIEMIRGSYIMIDPQGRFFDSTSGSHRYSRPILDVGMDAAFTEVSFEDDKFLARGGDADYSDGLAA